VNHSVCRQSLAKENLDGSLLRKHVINLPHDPLGPLNGCGHERFGPRAGSAVKQIVRGFQVSGDEDSRHNRQHALAALVHDEKDIKFAFCSPMKIRAKETSPVVHTCGVSVLEELRRTTAVLGGLKSVESTQNHGSEKAGVGGSTPSLATISFNGLADQPKISHL